jgi:putative addiction module component (TIGR02574 family)
MSAVLQQLGVDRMTIAERIALAQEILATVLADQSRPVLTEAKKRELDRRLADQAANPNDCVSRRDVEAAMGARYGK